MLKKKFIPAALIIPVLLNLTGIINACSYSAEISPIQQKLIEERNFQEAIYGIAVLFLVSTIVFTYFILGRKSFWTVLSAFISLISSGLLIGYIETSCGNPFTLTIIKTESAFLAILFIYQIFSWIKQKRNLKINLP